MLCEFFRTPKLRHDLPSRLTVSKALVMSTNVILVSTLLLELPQSENHVNQYPTLPEATLSFREGSVLFVREG